MRLDTPVYFQAVKDTFDASTGNYTESVEYEVLRYASVTTSGVRTLNLVYGAIKEGVLTIRLQNAYNAPFDRIRIGEKLYKVDFERTLRTKHIFVVSEVQ